MSMTDTEVLSMIRDDTPLNRIRQIFHSGRGRLEQAEAQRRPPTPIEARRMEFEIAKEILSAAERPLTLLMAALIQPLLDALRNAADLDAHSIYDLLADTGIIRREHYDPEVHENPHFMDEDVGRFYGAEPGEEIWVLTELGKRFAGKEG